MPPHRTMIVNTMVSSHFEIYHVHNTVSQHTSLHYHDFHEINCALTGSGVFHLNGNEYPTEPGTVTFVHRNDLHDIVKQSSDYYERAYFYIREEFLSARSTTDTDLNTCFAENGRPASHVIRVDPEWLRAQIACLDVLGTSAYGADVLAENRFVEFLIHLTEKFLDSDNDVIPYDRQVSSLVSSVMNYVGENLDADLSLDTIAKKFYVSKYYLSREFRKSTGLNFHSYTLKKRLLRSKDLLSIHGSAQKVYPLCGFTSYTHFLRCFKQEFQMTTREFVRLNAHPDIVNFVDHSASPGGPAVERGEAAAN